MEQLETTKKQPKSDSRLPNLHPLQRPMSAAQRRERLDLLRKTSLAFRCRPLTEFLYPSVFHPKIYLFSTKERWEALIGSANLTNGAFNKNAEAMLLFGGDKTEPLPTKKAIKALMQQYWVKGEIINKTLAENYRTRWELKQPELRHLAGLYQEEENSRPRLFRTPIKSEVMSMSWNSYFLKVQKDRTHGVKKRCEFLKDVSKIFNEFQSFSLMDLDSRRIVAGLPTTKNAHWGWFGSMKGAGVYYSAVINNNIHISNALDVISLHGNITRKDYDHYISEFIKAFPNGKHGLAVATRLLALKRPDFFVCLDTKNRKGLCRHLGVAYSTLDYEKYWNRVIEMVHDTSWWNAPRPQGGLARDVWERRVAMLDSIFYEE